VSTSSGDPRRDLHGTPFQAQPLARVTARARRVEPSRLHRERSHRHSEYELDKTRDTSHRIGRSSSPAFSDPYGFIPQTYCGAKVLSAAPSRYLLSDWRGTLDPLDICVLTEKPSRMQPARQRQAHRSPLRISTIQPDGQILASSNLTSLYGHMRDFPTARRESRSLSTTS